MTHSDLTHADLTRAMLYRAKLEHAELNGAVLPSAHLEKADLTNANLVRADLKGAHLASAELVQADLTGANLSGAQVDASTSFIGATLTDADFFGVNVRCLDLAGVEYSKAKNFDRPEEGVPIEPGSCLTTSDDGVQSGGEGPNA